MIWRVRNPRSRRTRGVLGVLGFEARRWEYRRSIAAAVARATRYALPCRASKTRCVLPRPRRKHDGQAYHAPPRAWWRWRKRPINETPGKMRHTRSGSGPPGAKRVQTSYTPFSCFLQHSLYPFSPYHGFSLQASRRPLRCCQERYRPPCRRATDGQRGTPVDSSVGAATHSMSSFMSCARPIPTARCCRRTINHLITAMINNHKMRGRGETITEKARERARLQTSRRM